MKKTMAGRSVFALAPAFPLLGAAQILEAAQILGAAQGGRRHRVGAHAGISARVRGEVRPLSAAVAVPRDQFSTPFPGTTAFGGPPV